MKSAFFFLVETALSLDSSEGRKWQSGRNLISVSFRNELFCRGQYKTQSGYREHTLRRPGFWTLCKNTSLAFCNLPQATTTKQAQNDANLITDSTIYEYYSVNYYDLVYGDFVRRLLFKFCSKMAVFNQYSYHILNIELQNVKQHAFFIIFWCL